jgi:hypothetical protein
MVYSLSLYCNPIIWHTRRYMFGSHPGSHVVCIRADRLIGSLMGCPDRADQEFQASFG